MPLQATSGAASYDAFGGGAAAIPNYIEEVFSTYLYTGNGTSQTITNGIDLSTKGGLVWLKARSQAYQHGLFDTVRGASKGLVSNTTAAEATFTSLTSFNTDGFSLGSDYNGGATYASWTFREQAKFFDVVTWTGNGVDGRAISHNLGSAPGCIIVKRTDSTSNWNVYHRQAGGSGAAAFWGRLNTTDSDTDLENVGPSGTPTTTFLVYDASLGLDSCNINGATYVAYLFAHNAGGFGLTGTDNVILCGSFTTDGSGNATVNLGYEPQWVLWKKSDGPVDAYSNWTINDNMRGFTVDQGSQDLYPNRSDAEAGTGAGFGCSPTSTGFKVIHQASKTYIYIAIRRGPMKVPTDATKVFYPQSISQADNIDSTGVPFPPDLVNTFSRNGTDRFQSNVFNFIDRLRGLGTPNNTYTASGQALTSSSTGAEFSATAYVQLKADSQNITRGSGWNSASYGNWINYFWRRAPSFFDEVCYTGDGTATRTLAHNLTVAPEWIIVRKRNSGGYWNTFFNFGSTSCSLMTLDDTAASGSTSYTGNFSKMGGAPTSSSFFVTNPVFGELNDSGTTYVTYLFATCAGVSKVGSYTGNGSTQTINCGFSGGARFVIIKRTDSTGDWYVYDTARGMTVLTDPYLLLNSTAAESATLGSVTTVSTGFAVNASILAAINTNGASYIFLSIA
jgi:hypothetical protein